MSKLNLKSKAKSKTSQRPIGATFEIRLRLGPERKALSRYIASEAKENVRTIPQQVEYMLLRAAGMEEPKAPVTDNAEAYPREGD